ncbi:MAG TPA: YceI family protein [Candidatus Limnocylindrales bacterium]
MTVPRRRTGRSPLVLALIGLVGLAVLGGAAGLAYLFLRPAPPAAVGLGSAAPGSSDPAATIGALPSGAAATLGAGGANGTWTVDQTIGRFSDFSDSFVGYRVDETLASSRANTAVGRTAQVTGTLTLDGASVTAVDIRADLTRLTSDDDRRDGQLHQQALETDLFPTATFKLTAPLDLGAAPVDGQTLSATATGDLTLHGVTKSVQVPIKALLSGDVVTVTGSLEIQFADYQIQEPVSFAILSIEDHGVMEFQLHFRHD